jgi:Protein of unknown function (DUF2971)
MPRAAVRILKGIRGETAMPAALWHYTDAAGLHGMLESNGLRFGNVKCLNDQTEHQYAWSVIQAVIEAELKKRDVFAAVLEQVQMAAHQYATGDNLFICSFSRRRDSIAQWQRYGANGSGYCVALSMPELLPRLTKFAPIRLREIIYSSREQRLVISRIIRSLRSKFYASSETQNLALEDVVLRLLLAWHELALIVKNPHFRDEREWRLILFASSLGERLRSELHFAPSGNVIKPYITVPAAETDQQLIPIKEIIYGPMLNAELAATTLRYGLQALGHSNVKMVPSALTATWR